MDTETDSVDQRTANLGLVAIAVDDGEPKYFTHPDQQAEAQAEIAKATQRLVAWKGGYDFRVLLRHGYDLGSSKNWDDGRIAAHVAGFTEGFDLKGHAGEIFADAVADLLATEERVVARKEEIYQERRAEAKRNGGKLKDVVKPTYLDVEPEILGPYCCADVALTRYLDLHHQATRPAKLDRVMELERQLLGPVLRIEMRGVPVDESVFTQLVEQAKRDRDVAFELLEPMGLEGKVSAKNLEPALLARGVDLSNVERTPKSGEMSIGEEALNKIDDDLVRAIISYKRASKRHSELNRYWKFIRDGRIYGFFHPLGTEMGRFSATEPNLENVPNDETFRELFKAPEGMRLVGADQSAIESRMVAYYTHFVGGGQLLRLQQAGEDIHQYTANQLGITRDQAKRVNHSITYGATPKSIMSQLGVSYDRAEEILRGHSETFPELDKLRASVASRIEKNGYITTVSGRRQRFDDPWDRSALHALISGSCADLFEQAIIDLDDEGLEIVNVIHDEILLQCHAHDVERVKDLVTAALCRGTKSINRIIPLKAEAHDGQTWAELKNKDFAPILELPTASPTILQEAA